MFTLKLKGDNKTENVNQVKLKLKGNSHTIITWKDMDRVLDNYYVKDIKIFIWDKFYPVWTLKFNDYKDYYMCEGVEIQ